MVGSGVQESVLGAEKCTCSHKFFAVDWVGLGVAWRNEPRQAEMDLVGVFPQRAHSANYYVVYPGKTPENHPPAEGCMINSKQHGVQNSGPWDPWQASDKKKSLVYQQGGCRVQNSGPWDPWLPVMENSRLFAQRTVRSPRTGRKA